MAMTREDRAGKVRDAINGLPTLIRSAIAVEEQHGADAPETLAAWETVEMAGATIHRQARRLAGKSRGG